MENYSGTLGGGTFFLDRDMLLCYSGYMENLISLPRGGYIVDTSIGYIQFGSPPETIKDSMLLPKGVPQYFVLPETFFNWIKGISVAEVEFPLYYNFFLKKRKTHIICKPEQYKRFPSVLREAVFGPEALSITEDFDPSIPSEQIPQLEKELAYFRGKLQLSDLVEFLQLENNAITIDGVQIHLNTHGVYHVHDGKDAATSVPSKIEYVPTYDIGKRLAEPFKPPLFGITCLGPSNGFDPTENSAGFILWLNKRGIMIDPPVNTTEWLIDSNVSPKLTKSIILTHCHADHDAGTLQKILEEKKVTVYSTKTVINSFIRKYSALTNVSPDYLTQLFNFCELTIGKPIFINGAKFTFQYSLHSIPTIGFTAELSGKTFTYSSDHNNEEKLHKKLRNDGIINRERYNELRNFNWDSDLIYHESGIPPLHTPMEVLTGLDPDIQKKTVVYHIAKTSFPEKTDLTLAQFGIEHTQYIDINKPKYEQFYHILGLLQYLDFLEDIPISKAQEFITIVEEKSYKKGEVIIKKGTPGTYFYIIKRGNVSVPGQNLEQRKIYGVNDSFGEVALLTNKPRSVDIIAETDVKLYTIERDKFLYFIEGTELKNILHRLSQIRDEETWNTLSSSPILRILTSSQKTLLESLLHKMEVPKAGTILRAGDPIDKAYIIRKGEIDVVNSTSKIATLGRGDFIGAMVKIHREEPADFTYAHKGPVSLYYIKKEDVLYFLTKNPGLIMKLAYDFSTD